METMRPTLLLLLVVASAAATTHAAVPVHHRAASCVPQERDALLGFKRGITGDPAGRLASWQEGDADCCRWRGVRCSNRTGHVVGLHLRNDYYPENTALSGQISPCLLSLQHLERLDLGVNNLSGPADRVPEFLGLLKDLRYLNLSGMPLSGRLPPQLGNLSKLQYLDFSVVPSAWSYPNLYSTDISWLSNLPLRYLDLDFVNLSRAVDWAHTVNMVPSLKVLRLPDCSLTSANQSLPRLNLTNLVELSLFGVFNDLHNPVASCWFWNLTRLQHLEVWGTQLYGRIPDALGGMTSLQTLDFSDNNIGNIMTENTRNLCNLEILDIRNNKLDGNIMELLPRCSTNKLKELHLGYNYFKGMLPNWIGRRWSSLLILELYGNQFTGPVPSEISMHENIYIIDLSNNQFTGHVPPEIGMLNNLLNLDLSSNRFTGHVPPEIGMLNNLLNLDLSSNRFIGPVPFEIGMLNNLSSIDLSHNKFTGPAFHVIGMLNNLSTLDLSNNGFTGNVPSEIGLFNGLFTLDLSGNQFTGPVPSEIRWLSILNAMDLSSNNFTGVITDQHLANLTSLKIIDLSSNFLKIEIDPEWLPPFKLEHASFANCKMGPLFPAWLQTQADVVHLNISSTLIFDRLPDWFATTFSKAEIVDISNNGIKGTLPTNIEEMTLLQNFYLSSNQLTGPIPQLPILLSELDISKNSLSGPLPSNFGTQYLEYLNLASNHISGPIPQSICQLEKLISLNLANNLFDMEFPSCFEPRMVRILILHNNGLSGKFPLVFETWTNLYIVDLAWNKFFGRLPMWIGNFAGLRVLQLSHNMFTGSIPETITRLQNLSQLSLAGNSISGPLPRHLSNLTGMKSVHTTMPLTYFFGVAGANGSIAQTRSTPHVNLSVIMKGQERYYKDDGLYAMVSIDLSWNQFTGGIPGEITLLDGIINLNLSWNNLMGKIPANIGVMQSLESLDLKENKIYGDIPQSMSNLTYLEYLDLSQNDLSGRIPSGGQLDTLFAQNPFMYDGNIGLCGYPLDKKCSDNSEPKHGYYKRDEHDSNLMSFHFGLGVGCVVGLWVIFCVILFKKSGRIAYFRLFDKVQDKVYVFVVVTWARWTQNAITN